MLLLPFAQINETHQLVYSDVSAEEAERLERRHFADCSTPAFRQMERQHRWSYIQKLSHPELEDFENRNANVELFE